VGIIVKPPTNQSRCSDRAYDKYSLSQQVAARLLLFYRPACSGRIFHRDQGAAASGHSEPETLKRSAQMKTQLFSLAVIVSIAVGCSQTTTRKDVASAQDKLQSEQQKTSDTIRDAQRDVVDAQQRGQEHRVSRPVVTDVTPRDQRNIEKVEVNAAEKIAKQRERERAAAANVKDKEQEFQTSQARDEYVNKVEQQLADTDKRIDLLKQNASNVQGADKDSINRQVDVLKTQRDLAKKALNDLKSAELANWKNHQEHVQLALRDLDNSMKTVR
jgi:hypothetical protein